MLFEPNLSWHFGTLQRAALVHPDASKSEADVYLATPRSDVHRDVLPKCCIEILLLPQTWGGAWWMPLHVTDVSAPIDYCNTSDTAWHKCVSMTAHLSSHFMSLSFFFFFPQYAKDLWTNRLKISSNHGLVWRETRLSGRGRRRGWILQR